VANDTTKYIFNGKEYGKGRLVLALVRHFIAENNPNLSKLHSLFPDHIQGSIGFIITQTDYIEKLESSVSKDIQKRFFIKEDESLKTSDGHTVFVSSQWGTDNIGDILRKAKELNFEVEVLSGEIKSIDELFQEYKLNPRNNWITRYKEICSRFAKYKNKPASEYDENILIDIWRSTDNGVAGVSPGFLSHDEFSLLRDDLPAITAKIVNDPSSEMLKSTYAWAKKAKQEGKLRTIKWSVINRVFSAANPEEYSTLLNEYEQKNLVNKLNALFNLGIEYSKNWAEQNKNLMNALKAEGLEGEDTYLINTFAWKLLELFGKKNIETEVNNSATDEHYMTDKSCQNVIYYGPPGTGKTFKLQKILKNDYTDSAVIQDRDLWLAEHIDNFNWFEILLLVLLDSTKPLKVADIISHEFYQVKAKLNNRTANLKQTAWAALQSHTVTNSNTVKYEKRVEPLVFDKDENSLWFIVESKNEQLEEYVSLLALLKEGPKQAETIKRFEFVTFHQSYGYEEFIEGLRPITNDNGDISYEVKPGVLKRICKRAESDPVHQYALVIDEINRGNISKIFGELISLVEIDKRKGCDNELTVTLPYSGLPFTVPANVNIIGTMNTADRSLTHIDVALRRRFKFKELRTDYSLLPSDVDGINIKHLLYTMNQRIELLLDREHILGHALFMKITSLSELAHIFKTNIMPLLEEYFFENWSKINQVLNDNTFIEEQKNAHNIWLGNNDEYSSKSFRIDFSRFENIEAYKKIYSNIDPKFFFECDFGTAVN
jgi:5-methylcytosine-specific restriction protein B